MLFQIAVISTIFLLLVTAVRYGSLLLTEYSVEGA